MCFLSCIQKLCQLFMSIRHIGSLLLCVIFLFTGCTSPAQTDHTSSEEKQTLRIGVAASLSGDAASYGEGLQAGIELALHDLKKNPRYAHQNIDIVYADSACNPSDGIAAYQKLIYVDQVDLIIGPVCSSAAEAGLPLTVKENIPNIIPAASAPNLPSLGKNIFRIYPSDIAQGAFVASYIEEQWPKKRVAVLSMQDTWGNGLHDIFVQSFKDKKYLVSQERFAPNTTDFRASLQKIKQKKPDIIYLIAQQGEGLAALKQIRELGIETTLIGGDTFDTPVAYESPYAENILYTTGNIAHPESFQQRIKEKTNTESNILSPLGYDALMIAVASMSIDNTPEGFKHSMKHLDYPHGISSSRIRFTQEGDLFDRFFHVKHVQNKNVRIIN